MNVKMIAQCAALIFVSALSGASVASASEYQPASVTVKFGDLDLKSAADVSTLYLRIKHASYQVCSIPEAWNDITAWRLEKECRRTSMDRAVQQVGVPALIEMHQNQI